ncbi:MAG: ATP-dependent RNA helicase HrpA [Desulfamplus sp.]|nr:ATP-dependent RNA helicase HrpA [Desulfamplus sp.]
MNKINRSRKQIKIPTINYIKELPITDKKDEIIEAIKKNRVVIIAGETGSGKTTQIPKFCIATGRGVKKKIGCTQPRRIAAINVAARIAEELGQSFENFVGYKIRFDDTSASDTIIKVMTDGILLAEAQRDPFLNEYDTIIVDEAHERSLNIDFTLGILRGLIKKRNDLKVIITSATIDTEKFSKAFNNAPIIEVSGRMYPVEVRYLTQQRFDQTEKDSILGEFDFYQAQQTQGNQHYQQAQDDQDDQSYVEAAVEAVEMINRESRQGDILIFMPTEQDITETIELLRGRNWVGVTVLPLYARLSALEQSKIFHRGVGRKIIVSTNVAETSLTIPGIKYVVDTGLARVPHYSPRTRTTALPVTPISRSSADQRKGRCGRVENGICIRLYDEQNYNSRAMFTSPEILRSNLAEVILRMISLNLGDVSSFPFIDMPSPKSIKDGFDTLLEIGAIEKGKTKGYQLTQKGKIMAQIPVDPKLSRILIEAHARGCLQEAAIIASALSISDPRQRPQDKMQQADQKHAAFKDPASDFITLLNIWSSCYGDKSDLKSRSSVRKFCKDNYLSFRRMREWSDIYRQIILVLNEHGVIANKKSEHTSGGEFYASLHKSILCGYLSSIAHKKEKNLYQAAKGQKAMIFPGSSIFNKAGNWIVAAEYVETSQLFARVAATIDVDWLEELGSGLCTYSWSSPHWEKKRGEVVAKEQVSLFGLIIVSERSVAYGKINPVEAGEIFIRHALVLGEIDRKFGFMMHNQKLIEELQEVEEKMRKRDILVTEEDIYLFYQSRLERDFYNIKTFAKYIKDKKDDSFLRMSLEDLRKKSVDEEHLAGFPDTIKIGDLGAYLEYDFKPGAETDGVTLKLPATTATRFIANQADSSSIDWLVPGLFREKILALIKNLPKSHRIKLLPASQKADIIATEIQNRGRPLFYELSRFVKERFNANIPPSAWSDEGIEPHLKMRISLRDDEDKEIAASRDLDALKPYVEESGYDFQSSDGLKSAKSRWEIDNVISWDFLDRLNLKSLSHSIKLESKDGINRVVFELFLALVAENLDSLNINQNPKVALRLFRRADEAEEAHKEGIRNLFIICYPNDMEALKKDIKGATRLKSYSQFFGGFDRLNQALYRSITRHLFWCNIRTKEDFEAHAAQNLPKLYQTGQEFISKVIEICQEYQVAMEALQNIALKNMNRSNLYALIENLELELKELVPPNFLDLYQYNRLKELKRYILSLKIRAERAVVDMVRDQKRWAEVSKYVDKLQNVQKKLSEDGSSSFEFSKELIEAVDNLFFMIQEYKVSLFAQELKTAIKISAARLDKISQEIDNMI